ncbi:unnamed protein product [Kuraishia capsulata CBS 1993]|uniref:Uncharacterized protein n=1 Tax=Kuraishia capsulata CBS 1993 TaxID=1382522 RepID=W6MJH9_9ASCO|nr:uncharacterized protein KUCA_T00002668001 [Kuraishia capsulata CBS 1993]CDK26694.1 unnamed protein product [Kuraishia capsulata CBS 1993]
MDLGTCRWSKSDHGWNLLRNEEIILKNLQIPFRSSFFVLPLLVNLQIILKSQPKAALLWIACRSTGMQPEHHRSGLCSSAPPIASTSNDFLHDYAFPHDLPPRHC